MFDFHKWNGIMRTDGEFSLLHFVHSNCYFEKMGHGPVVISRLRSTGSKRADRLMAARRHKPVLSHICGKIQLILVLSRSTMCPLK